MVYYLAFRLFLGDCFVASLLAKSFFNLSFFRFEFAFTRLFYKILLSFFRPFVPSFYRLVASSLLTLLNHLPTQLLSSSASHFHTGLTDIFFLSRVIFVSWSDVNIKPFFSLKYSIASSKPFNSRCLLLSDSSFVT